MRELVNQDDGEWTVTYYSVPASKAGTPGTAVRKTARLAPHEQVSLPVAFRPREDGWDREELFLQSTEDGPARTLQVWARSPLVTWGPF